MVLKFFIRALSDNISLFHDDNIVSQVDEFNSMSHKDAGLSFHQATKYLIKDVFSNMRVKRRDWVIHDENIRALVNSTSKCNSSLLTTREIDTLLTNLSLVTSWHDSKIRLKLAGHHGLDVLPLIEIRAEKNVLAKLAILNPSLLFAEACGAIGGDGAVTSQVSMKKSVLKVVHLTVRDEA